MGDDEVVTIHRVRFERDGDVPEIHGGRVQKLAMRQWGYVCVHKFWLFLVFCFGQRLVRTLYIVQSARKF